MNDNLLSWLTTTGLDEQRARLYLACLEHGTATPTELAHALKVNRTAIYDNLDVLEKMGYVQLLHEGKRKLYVPLHPKELYKRFDSQREQLKDLLPDFLSVYAEKSTQPMVQTFQGKFAGREIHEDILRVTKKEYVYLAPPRLALRAYEKGYIEDWIKRKVKKGLHSRSLRTQGQGVSEEIFNKESEYNRQIRYLPGYVELKSSIYLYEHNIGVISTADNHHSFIIHSPELAFSLKQVFEFLWNISTKS